MHKHHSCHHGSCGSGKGCSCGSSQGHGCHSSSCGCGSSSHKSCHEHHHCHHEHGHHSEYHSHEGHLLCLVKCVKHKLLREKIAHQLEVKFGRKLDELAAVAVDAFIAELEGKIHAKKTCCSFQEKISDIFRE